VKVNKVEPHGVRGLELPWLGTLRLFAWKLGNIVLTSMIGGRYIILEPRRICLRFFWVGFKSDGSRTKPLSGKPERGAKCGKKESANKWINL
jgi:hypothetical protein